MFLSSCSSFRSISPPECKSRFSCTCTMLYNAQADRLCTTYEFQSRSKIHFHHSCYGSSDFQIVCTDELKQVFFRDFHAAVLTKSSPDRACWQRVAFAEAFLHLCQILSPHLTLKPRQQTSFHCLLKPVIGVHSNTNFQEHMETWMFEYVQVNSKYNFLVSTNKQCKTQICRCSLKLIF